MWSGYATNFTMNLSSSSRFEAGKARILVKSGSSKPTRHNAVLCGPSTVLIIRPSCSSSKFHAIALMDWYSRYVLSWRLSNTLDANFCVDALQEALRKGRPDISNTDQGVQFTSEAFTGFLQQHNIRISMDGKWSYNDNLFIERLWRTVKYEEVYLKAYQDGREARAGLGMYFHFYDNQRPHQAHGYRTPAEVFRNGIESVCEGVIESLKSSTARIAGPDLKLDTILSD